MLFRSKNNIGVPFQEKSENRVNYSIVAEILGIGVKEAKLLLNCLEEEGYIHIDTAKKEMKVLIDVDTNVDTTVVYYEGTKYLSAFRLMNRYLNR